MNITYDDLNNISPTNHSFNVVLTDRTSERVMTLFTALKDYHTRFTDPKMC